MKIKRLTAGLAVAAMAATFFASAPIVSAQADVNKVSTGNPAVSAPAGYDIYAGDVAGNSSLTLNVFDTLLSDPQAATSSINDIVVTTPASMVSIVDLATNTIAPPNTTNSGYATVGSWISSWNCQAANVVVKDGSGVAQPSYGYVKCDNFGNLIFTPTLVMGYNGDIDVILSYTIESALTTDTLTAASMATLGISGAGDLQPTQIKGDIHLTVTEPTDPNACGRDAKCLNADVQAYDKKDTPNSVKIDLLTPNIYIAASNPTGILKAADTPANWGLAAVNAPVSGDTTIKLDTLKTFVTYTQGKGANTIKFTPPANWSGTVTYEYVIAKYTCGASGTDACPVKDPNGLPGSYTGLVTFTTHPTLPDIDPIASDPGAKVTVPVLEQTIIGSKAFMNAACTFADTKSKTTLAGTGTISNKGGSKDPIFTPDAAFTGSVDLACTVQDKFGIGSNSVTVTIQVGVPAPAPVAPTPACGDSCNGGKLVSTGGSLAAPMSSGLAAVVLLVAAGAGILVVRRRTALAG